MRALILDTETTDLVANRLQKHDKLPSIIEFYGCVVDLKNDKQIEELELLIKPPKSISQEVITITGIKDETVKDCPTFAEVAAKIKTLIEAQTVVIAHNASFDQEVIDIEFERLGQTIQWPRLICSVEQSIMAKGFRLNLTDLHEFFFKEKFKDAHRAKSDTQALRRCAVEMFRRDWI